MATYSETRNLDHLNQAIDLLQQAIARLPSSTPDYAECTGQLGKAISWRYVHSHQISDLEQAIQVLELSNRITPTISPNKLDRECDLGINLYWRYNIAKDPKDLSAAQSHLRDACIDGVYTNPDAVLTTSIIWGQNAVAHLAWSEATEAYTYALQATSALFRIQLSRDKKELWLAKAKRLPELAAYAFAKSGQLQSAVLALEMGRTRLLSEALNRDTARLKGLASSHPKLFIRYREIVNNLDSHQGKISSDTVVLPDLVQEVRAKTHELDSIINEIRQVNGYKDFLRESTWDDIKEVVLPGQPVVYFVTLTQYTGNLALLLRRQNPSNEVIIEPLWLDTFTNVDLLRAVFLSSNQLNQEDAKHRTAEHLDVTFAFLGDNILKPIAKRLHELGTREIVFVPSGVLGSLPLGAGRYSIDGKERYFLDEFDLALTPSLRVLSLSRAKLSSHHIDSPTLVGLANPLDHPSPLPYARVELEEIAKYYERGSRSALYEHQATKNALLEALPNADYIHFACHGEFKENEPMDSCLELANGEVLAIREILQLPHLERARLVVLSACQTAITDHANLPDEFVGLPLGFLKAGIPGVIGTLWPVNDLSTTLLTIRFYEYHRVSGYSPSKALRLAQQWLRDLTVEDLSYLGDWYAQREHQVPREAQSSYNLMQRTLKNISVERNPEARPFSQPYYWAPFVFYGV
jgi:CHAT domain-containing protein